jgi:hypothetical protein
MSSAVRRRSPETDAPWQTTPTARDDGGARARQLAREPLCRACQVEGQQQKKGMDAWMKWIKANKTSIVEGGAPLGKTKRVDSNGASNTKNEIGGYSVVQAESHDAATKIFGKDHPHLQMPGAWIEIIEIMPMPGM